MSMPFLRAVASSSRCLASPSFQKRSCGRESLSWVEVISQRRYASSVLGGEELLPLLLCKTNQSQQLRPAQLKTGPFGPYILLVPLELS